MSTLLVICPDDRYSHDIRKEQIHITEFMETLREQDKMEPYLIKLTYADISSYGTEPAEIAHNIARLCITPIHLVVLLTKDWAEREFIRELRELSLTSTAFWVGVDHGC